MSEVEGDVDGPTMTSPLQRVRPAADPLAMERARARTEAALFGRAEPAKFGRYHLLERIAGGGMGVVYRAYDPELDRRVALKVIHPHRIHDDAWRKRFVNEARTLAKLDHPNVVKVHDVVTSDDQIVIVMEFVEGETLAAWAERDRSWRASVETYLGAADGLVAAHSVNVIHRDFKPSNAILGKDGRVRVLDFGLARHDDREDSRPAKSPIELDLTGTGDVFGTLRYASPEQLRGERVTDASDQFSFCVALHHAVEKVSAFQGDTIAARIESIVAGRVVLGDVEVPAWLRHILARGLSATPAKRYPSMADLVAALRRPRGWARWRTPALGTIAVLGSIGVTLKVASNDAAADPCDGDPARIAAVWNADERAHLGRVLDGISTPYAREVRDRAVAQLDRYANDWTATHRAACRDHRRGATSAELLDRRMSCLGDRLGDLRAAVEVLGHTDATSSSNVMDVVARLPTITRCSDLTRLQSRVELPEGEVRASVSAARAKISTAEALARAGRSEAARATSVEATEAARGTGYTPVMVEAELAESRIMMGQDDLVVAATKLREVRKRAFELHMFAAGIEAAARLLYAEGMVSPNLAHLEDETAILIPLAASQESDHFARPLLLNNIGTVYLAAGRREDAAKYFELAWNDLGSFMPVDLELVSIKKNVAILTRDPVERTRLLASALEHYKDSLGESHPSTLKALLTYAEFEPDPAKAYERADRAAEAYAAYHPQLRRLAIVAYASRAFLASELGDSARTKAAYTAAIAKMTELGDEDIAIRRTLLEGELALEEQAYARCVELLEPVAKRRLAGTHWFERVDGLRATVTLGLAEEALGHAASAVRHLETAVAGYPAIIEINEEQIHRRLNARAQRALARLLADKHPARSRTLATAAAEFYRRSSYP